MQLLDKWNVNNTHVLGRKTVHSICPFTRKKPCHERMVIIWGNFLTGLRFFKISYGKIEFEIIKA